MTRTTLLAGPAAATFQGRTYFARDGIVVSPALELDGVESDAQGWLDDSVIDAPVTIRFVPSAPFADLVGLYPWLEGRPGTSLFGAEDSPLVLTAANGVRLTFAAAAIVGMPDLHLSAEGSVSGAVTFLALGARGVPITDPERLVSVDLAEMPEVFPRTPELTDDFVITWGGAPWLKLRARDGVKLTFVLATRPVVSDGHAQLDLTLEHLGVEARFTPASGALVETDLVEGLALQGARSRGGRSGVVTGKALEIAGEHLFIRLPLVQLVDGDLAFEVAKPRLGELVFRAERAFVGTGGMEALVIVTEGRDQP